MHDGETFSKARTETELDLLWADIMTKAKEKEIEEPKLQRHRAPVEQRRQKTATHNYIAVYSGTHCVVYQRQVRPTRLYIYIYMNYEQLS